jgi:hypothetical protein
MNQAFGEEWIGRWAQSDGLHDHLTSVLWIFGCGNCGVFVADQWLRGITAGRRGDRNETRNFRHSVHLCDEELKDVFQCMGTSIARMSAGIDFWTRVDWEFLFI